MLSSTEVDFIKNHDLIQSAPEYFYLLNRRSTFLETASNCIINAYEQRFVTRILPHWVGMCTLFVRYHLITSDSDIYS